VKKTAFNNFLLNSLLLTVTALVFFSCASAPTKPSQTAEPAPLTLPSGWDDSVIDRIKAGKSSKPVMAVLDFEGYDKLRGKTELSMADMLATALVKENRFDLVERTKIEKVIEEQSFGLSGLVDESSAAKVGELLGAEFLVSGVITSATRKDVDKFGYMLVQIEVGVDVRAVNTSTGEILISETAVGLNENKVVRAADGTLVSGAIDYKAAYAAAARDAVNKVAAKLSAVQPLIGFIVAVNGPEVTLDLGEEHGLRSGQTFIALRVLNEIRHPATGAHLGWEKSILGELSVTATEKSLSRANILRVTPNMMPKPGDYVISR